MDRERDLLEGVPEDEYEELSYRSIPAYLLTKVVDTIFTGIEIQATENKLKEFLKDKECPVLQEQLTIKTTKVMSCNHLISVKAFNKLDKKCCPLCRKDQNNYVPFLQEVFKERFLDE